jgi:hypothetical protein
MAETTYRAAVANGIAQEMERESSGQWGRRSSPLAFGARVATHG